ncbi:MAG: sugar ABC transporter permease, partial [Acidobacteriota bacterium]
SPRRRGPSVLAHGRLSDETTLGPRLRGDDRCKQSLSSEFGGRTGLAMPDPTVNALPGTVTSPRHRLTLKAAEQRLAWLLLAPALIAVAVLIAWPIYVVVQMSLRPGKALALSELMTRPLGLANYDRVMHQPALWEAFGHSAVYTVGSLAPAFLAGLLFALLFHRVFPARRWLRSLLLLPWAVPGVVVSITFLWMLDASYGVVNAILRDIGVTGDIAWFVDARTAMAAVIVPTVWKSFPFFTITLLAALQSIPASLYEAARVDGATAWQQFVHVTWPGIRRPALLAVLLNALWTFREFDIIYASTGGGPAGATETLGILVYREAFGSFRFGTAAAIGVLMLLTATVFVLLSMRRLKDELR